MQKITPFLWFDRNAEEAMKFYTSVFRKSRIVSVSRYDEAGAKASGMPKGTVMTGTFEPEGQRFMALNGGPDFKFTEAISFHVDCRTQQEVDELWEKLSEDGEPDPAKSLRVMNAMLKMTKLDIEGLRRAHAQAS